MSEENTNVQAYTRSWLIGITLILLGFLTLLLMLGWLKGLATMALFGGVSILASVVLVYAYLHPEQIWAGWASYLLFTVALFFGVGFLFDFQNDLKYYIAWAVFLTATPFMVLYIRRVLLVNDADIARQKAKTGLWWTALVTGGLYTISASLLQLYLGWPPWLLPGIITTVFMGGMTFTILMVWLPNKNNKLFSWLIPLMVITGLMTGFGMLLTFDLLILVIPLLLLGFGSYFLLKFFILAYLKKPKPAAPTGRPVIVTPYTEQLPPPASTGHTLPPGASQDSAASGETAPPLPLPEKPLIEINEAPDLTSGRGIALNTRPPILLPETSLLFTTRPDLPEEPPDRPDEPDTLPEEPAPLKSLTEKNTLTLGSKALTEGEAMPPMYTSCDGEQNISPPLHWQNIPTEASTLALLCVSPDAPGGIVTHWMLYNLPSTVTGLPAGIAPEQPPPGGGIQGSNSFGRKGYDGPNPPPGRPYHYQFHLYALDKAVELPPEATRQQFLEAITERNIIAWGALTVTYQREGPTNNS